MVAGAQPSFVTDERRQATVEAYALAVKELEEIECQIAVRRYRAQRAGKASAMADEDPESV